MNYNEALARTIKLNDYATEFNFGKIRYIVVPSNEKEMIGFLDYYCRQPSDQPAVKCKEYCSDGNFSVYRIDIHSDIMKDFAKGTEC